VGKSEFLQILLCSTHGSLGVKVHILFIRKLLHMEELGMHACQVPPICHVVAYLPNPLWPITYLRMNGYMAHSNLHDAKNKSA
jgi:hypothetical protein